MLGADIVDTHSLSSLVDHSPAHFRGTQDHVSIRKETSHSLDGWQLKVWGETCLGRPGSFPITCGTGEQVVNGLH